MPAAKKFDLSISPAAGRNQKKRGWKIAQAAMFAFRSHSGRYMGTAAADRRRPQKFSLPPARGCRGFLAAHSLNMHPTHLDLAALPFTYRSVSQTYAGRIPPLPAFQHAEEAAGLEPDQF
jgi:hypothetical protein